MRRTVRLHPATALTGLATLLSAGLVVAVAVAAPGSAAAAAPAVAAASTAAPTVTSATTTGPTTPATTYVSPSTYGPCPTYTLPAPWPNGAGPSWTFENGLATGWSTTAAPGASLAVTTEAAASGSRSLRVDGLTTTAGVQASVSGLPAVTWYKVTARVRAVAGSSPAYLTLSATPTNSDDRRPMTRRVTSDGWTDLVTYFRPDQKYPPGTCGGLGWVAAYTSLTITASSACPDAPAGPVSVHVDDVVATQYSTSSTLAPPTSTDQIPTCGTPPSSPPTTSAMQCTATYQVVSQWPGGHQANLTVRNMTAMTLHPWTLKVTFPDDNQLYSVWGIGTSTVSGRTVTGVEPAWGQPIPPGGSLSAGWVRTGTASPPSAVSLNGMPCIVGTQA